MSNSIFDKLSLGAINSTVTAFKNLVDDHISSTKNITSTLSSTVDNITSTGKNIINSATSTINNTTNNIINSATSTVNSIKDDLNNEYKKFKQTAESVVTEFDFDLYAKALKLPECQNVSFNYVEGLAGNLIGTFTGSKTYKDFNGTIESSINGAVSQLSGSISSQLNNVTSQISGTSSQITGAVTQLGNKFSGQLSGTISQVGGQIGKAILDPSAPGYAIFTNNDITEIISIDDFNPESLIDDFSDLYQTLLNNKFSKLENYTSDIKSLCSLFTSFSEFTSDGIIGTISDQFNTFTGDLVDNVSGLWDSASTDIFSTIDSFKNIVIPDTINSTQTTLSIPDVSNKYINNVKLNSTDDTTDTSLGTVSDIAKGISDLTGKKTKSTTNNIKPINLDPDGDGWVDQNRGKYKHIKSSIYDTINKAPIQAIITYDGLASPLICYQQPENLSYSASAQFDGIPSRGTQQPFQFYNCANQITLGFSLKWHYDELLLYGLNKTYPSLQEIANIAEDFTRPFQIGTSETDGNSITPKLCTVILPSLSEIGYITEAQISFGGAMTGTDPYNESKSSNYSAVDENNRASVTRNGDDYIYKTHVSNTNYQYSTLEISFQLLIVKDITLKPDTATQKAIKEKEEADRQAKEEADRKKLADAHEAARKNLLEAQASGDTERIAAAQQLLDSLDFDNGMSVGMPVLPEEPVSDAVVSNQANYEASISSNSRNVTTPYEDYNSNSSQPAQNASISSKATNVSNVSAANNTTNNTANKDIDYYQLLLDRGMDASTINYIVTTENITPKEIYEQTKRV
jgi:hypothetical protein